MPANEHAVASSASSKPPSPDRNVKSVVLGNIRFKTWFHSLYPEELVGKDTDRIYVCRWCFRYSCDKDAYLGHTRFCEHRSSPPGTKVYDWRGYSVWEIDGEDHKLYAQNLSLFAKLFLDHKSVFFDVSSFLYYILVFTNPQDANDYHERISRFFLLGPPGAEPYGRNIASASTSSSWSPRPMGGDSKGAKRKAACEEMTIREIGQATGMLVEDVITALKEMGIVEPEKPGKKRKRAPLSSTATTTTATGVVDSDAAEAVVRKQSVLEWAKIHRVDLKDPVAEEGFLGEWAPEDEDQEDEETDSGD
ncbi:histone acetyltransferase [Histoplasma capsulatum var. duboisii H88]|uniref:histone acetyltransferase n=1 Tax=Ajellomyces capsulatus (strain H88) TaxID=544711 RepID=F0U6I4_AJEC8|nr:histone acetyltransferase [Histoplasma capsulatum var. duboisii H88]